MLKLNFASMTHKFIDIRHEQVAEVIGSFPRDLRGHVVNRADQHTGSPKTATKTHTTLLYSLTLKPTSDKYQYISTPLNQ